MIMDAFSLALSWAALLQVVLSGSGVLQIFLFALGITGAVGASASLYGSIVLAAIVALRVAIKLGKEIWRHKNEFNALWTDKDRALISKGLHTLLILVKCLFWAGLKTLLTDFIVSKISEFLAAQLLTNIRDWLKAWPSKETIKAEMTAIDQLSTALSQPDNLNSQHQHTGQKLALGVNDLRADNEKFTQGQTEFNQSITRLETNYKQLSVLNQALPADQPAAQQAPVIVIPEAVSIEKANYFPVSSRPTVQIDWKAYYQLLHQPTVMQQATQVFAEGAAMVVDIVRETARTLMDLPGVSIQFALQSVSYYMNRIVSPIQSKLIQIQQTALRSIQESIKAEKKRLDLNASTHFDNSKIQSSAAEKPAAPVRSGWLPNFFQTEIPRTDVHLPTVQNEL
jgi:hypothetical protein